MDKFIFWIVHGHQTLYCSYLRTVQGLQTWVVGHIFKVSGVIWVGPHFGRMHQVIWHFQNLYQLCWPFIFGQSSLPTKKIILHIDNQALVSVLNKRSSKSKMVMSLVRPLVLKCMQYNILFRAVYIPTKLNIIADSISRKQWDRFRQAAPRADHFPLPIPSAFTNLISSLNLTSY